MTMRAEDLRFGDVIYGQNTSPVRGSAAILIVDTTIETSTRGTGGILLAVEGSSWADTNSPGDFVRFNLHAPFWKHVERDGFTLPFDPRRQP